MNIELTEQEYKVVIAALGELPAKMSMGVIARINQQVQEQMKDEGGDEE